MSSVPTAARMQYIGRSRCRRERSIPFDVQTSRTRIRPRKLVRLRNGQTRGALCRSIPGAIWLRKLSARRWRKGSTCGRRLRSPRRTWISTRFRTRWRPDGIAATVVEPSGFRSGREFAAWLGLVPRQTSTGGKHRLGGISKRCNQYLRWLLINGASANLLRSKATKADPWVIGLRQRRPSLVVAVALANKTARIAWAVMHRHENYQCMAAAA